MNNGNTVRVQGYVVGHKETAKAWRWTCLEYVQDGEYLPHNADTVWLPKSQCSNVRMFESVEPDGGKILMVEADIPVWLFKTLDARPAWVRRGDRSAPVAQRAW